MTPKEYIEGFDKRFNFFKDIRITPRQAGGFEKAERLQRFYQNSGEEIKSFLIFTVISDLKEQVVEVEKLIPNLCDCTGVEYACEHWGKHEAVKAFRLSLENKIKEWELLDNK